MKETVKMFGLAALLGALLTAGGCGDDGSPGAPNPSANAPIVATINPDGTARTGASSSTAAAPPGTPGYLAGVSATLPPNTVITAKNADGTVKALSAPLSFTFTAPVDSSATFSGIGGVPAPTGLTTLTSTSGAVDVQLTGAASATFNPAITITMPVPGKAVGTVIDVYTVTGETYTFLGSFTVTSAGFVSFPVSSLSWKIGDPDPDPNVPRPTTTVSTTVPTTTPTTVVSTTTVPTTTPTTVATTSVPTTIATTVPTTTTTTVQAIDGAALYASTCQSCHGPLAAPTLPISSRTVAGIRSAGMAFGLSDAQLLAIIAVLP